jgi:hypothetical protein
VRLIVPVPVLVLAFALTACGGTPKPATTPPPDPDPQLGASSGSTKTGPAHDTRTPLVQRRDAACEALGPKITQCAVADAKQAARDGKITQKKLSEITEPPILAKNTEKFVEKCEVQMSSRQVRVLEVCNHAESECDPLLACLEHLHDPAQ